MRILLTADPELPVPPLLYGGIERIVDMLARGLAARGHEVTLLAHAESCSAGRLVPWPGTSSANPIDTLRNTLRLTAELARGRYDVLHSFSRIAYMLPALALGPPKLMTYQRPVTRRAVVAGHRIARGKLHFSAISRHMMRTVADVGTWHMVPNGVPLSTYAFRPAVATEAPLVFLGRLEEIKGPHIAVDVARRSGRRLVLAGNIPPEHRNWYDANVAPHVDDDRIKFIGAIDDVQKNQLLGSASALLMPILWEEPFGIVMAEAMACGTPVIGFRRGSVPEIVEDGTTGFVVDTVEEMAAGVGNIGLIDRAAVRSRAERLYSDDAVVTAYIGVYERMVAAR